MHQKLTEYTELYSPLLADSDASQSNDGETTSEDDYNIMDKSSTDTLRVTSNISTFVHLTKGSLGVTTVALPAAVSHAGVVVGPIGIVLIAVITVHCMHLLLTSAHIWRQKNRVSYISYGDLGEECFELRFPGKGHLGRFAVNFFLFLLQVGLCSTYVLFVATNLHQTIIQTTSFNMDVRIWILIILPVCILLSFIKNLNVLSWVSLIATVCFVVGLSCIAYFLSRNVHNPTELPNFVGFEKLALFFGVAIFSVEVTPLILPLENAMRDPKQFRWMMNIALVITTVLSVTFAFFGYLSCTDHCKGSFTLNINERPLSYVVNIMMSLAIFLSYFIQMYVVISFLEPLFLSRFHKGSELVRSLYLRASFVIFTGVCAAVIPHLEIIVSLTGSICSSTIILVFPTLFHSISAPRSSWAVHIKNIVIAICGVFAGALGTTLSIKELVDVYTSSGPD